MVALGLVGVVPGAASAVEGEDWWQRHLGVSAANQAGADGRGRTVAVIDSAITPDLPMFEGVDLRVREPSFCASDGTIPATSSRLTAATSHGTNTAGLVARTAPKATILFYATDDPASNTRQGGVCSGGAIPRAIVQAVSDGADVISISMSGNSRWDYQAAVAWAQHQGVVIVSSLPNDFSDIRDSDEASRINGVVAVAAHDAQGRFPGDPGVIGVSVPYGRVTVRAPGVGMLIQGDMNTGNWSATRTSMGTSYATPVTAGVLAAVWSKYPDATGSQMIQALIQSAGNGYGLEYDSRVGYGLLSLERMLQRDPTTYPDVNPLVQPEPQFERDISAADIENAVFPPWMASETPMPSPTSTDWFPEPGPAPGGGVPGWVWLLVVAVVLVGAVVAVVIVVVRRK
ncbi:MAG: S8/S53 family peptidase [Micrococcales bacterium]|nr:S8/S53 family peptidase [Micrococcales bacterium]